MGTNYLGASLSSSSGILKPSKGDRNGKNTPRVFPVNSELADLIMAIPQKETIHREPRISQHLNPQSALQNSEKAIAFLWMGDLY